jgi:hypothetical protein
MRTFKPSKPDYRHRTEESKVQTHNRRERASGRPSNARSRNSRPPTAGERVCPAYQVRKESFAVLHAHVPLTSDQEKTSYHTGQTRWNSILKALADTRFDATDYGGPPLPSAIKERIKVIIFHRPHPELKIDHVELSWIGKRLTRNFRWRRESVVLASRWKENERNALGKGKPLE